ERHAAAAQDRLDARDELAGTEGLADVVVGAKVETDQAVDLLDPRGDHYDRNGAERAQLAADLQAVAPGEHQVEQDKVRRMLAAPLDHLQAVRDAMRFKPLGAKVIGLERRQLGLVLDDEDLLHAATGSETAMRRPPSREGEAAMSPPCAATMLRQIARP